MYLIIFFLYIYTYSVNQDLQHTVIRYIIYF